MSSGATQLMVTEERVVEEVKTRLSGGEGGPVQNHKIENWCSLHFLPTGPYCSVVVQ